MQDASHIEYVVRPENGRWTVAFQGLPCGFYGDRRAALRSAVADARRVRERGYDIKVRVRRPDGSIRTLPERLLRDDA